ncbi:hypothetical protein BB347_12445 [Natronorubrum daqingense]|uniref:Uncharacterized protein n=1 Tax=Natronorubrum daqingense TaxID=588898 RepID=A0A1P8RFF1_9EURY|nr:hypothetical protein BB347_12445 [Natronorubrum daqingense]
MTDPQQNGFCSVRICAIHETRWSVDPSDRFEPTKRAWTSDRPDDWEGAGSLESPTSTVENYRR